MEKLKNYLKKPVFWSFLICFLYWIYLFFTSHPVLSCDAFDYEYLGKLFYENRWLDYFKNGPMREPFYPLLVSLAMRLGNYFSISYLQVITIFQLLILLLTQLITLHILRLLKIKDMIIALTILYLGISPAIVNSALSLFSEIATYPIILSIVLVSYYAWLSFNKSKVRVTMLAISSGILFCLVTLSKGIFEIITPVFIILVFILSLFTRKRKFILNAFSYLLIASAVFYAPITAYKLTNKIFNGHFAITNRGDYALYGATARRTESLTTKHFFTALAFVPGEGFCQGIFGKEECSYWGFERIYGVGYEKLDTLKASGLQPEDASRSIVRLAIKKALQNPAQYTLFWMLEGVKMLFWESTQIGFVAYPRILETIFNWKLFKNTLRLSIFILTFMALIYLVRLLWRKRKMMFTCKQLDQENTEIFLILCLFLISLFIGAYSLVSTVPRFSLPIAPLCLIVIAFFFQQLLAGGKTNLKG